ncbi:putative ABM domain-containing protein [Seiridium cardinale]|uniref:ABM domain-containing protein n=1 Tax=Seiridium cardinale TaxID=138064 RepID=A0ABR2XUJ5_9PEZI
MAIIAVTELLWLTAPAGTFTSECKRVSYGILDVQDRWCANNAPELPKGK